MSELYYLYAYTAGRLNLVVEYGPIRAESFDDLGPKIEAMYGNDLRALGPDTGIYVLTEDQQKARLISGNAYLTRIELPLTNDEV